MLPLVENVNGYIKVLTNEKHTQNKHEELGIFVKRFLIEIKTYWSTNKIWKEKNIWTLFLKYS